MAGSGFELLAIAARSLSPVIVAVWLALVAGLAILRFRQTKSEWHVRRKPVREATILAILYVTVAIVWHQTFGEFVPFGRAWPSALAMSLALAVFFVAFVNLQERISVGISFVLLTAGVILFGIFYLAAFFVIPRMVRFGMTLISL